MMRATEVKPKGTWSRPPADLVTLDHESRHRRRIAMAADHGLNFVLDLAHTAHLRDGDGLVLEDGRIVEVRSLPEELMEVRGRSPQHLTQLAWHIGNRHLAAQVGEVRILIRRDHVIADMLRGLGARIRDVVEPFDPEGGAYGGVHHSHHHG